MDMYMTDSVDYALDVRLLPDVITPGTHSTVILTKTVNKISKRHAIAFLEFSHGIKYIHTQCIEKQVQQICVSSHQKILGIEDSIKKGLDSLRDDGGSKTIELFLNVWESIAGMVRSIFVVVNKLGEDLINAEIKRLDMIKSHTKDYYETFLSLGHWTQQKTDDFFTSESFKINTMSVANYKQYAELCSKLKTNAALVLKRSKAEWELLLLDFRDKLVQKNICSIKELLNSEGLKNPVDVEDARQVLYSYQQEMNDEIAATFSQFVQGMPTNHDYYDHLVIRVERLIQNKHNTFQEYFKFFDEVYENLNTRIDAHVLQISHTLETEESTKHSETSEMVEHHVNNLIYDYKDYVIRVRETDRRYEDEEMCMIKVTGVEIENHLNKIYAMWDAQDFKVRSHQKDLKDRMSKKRNIHLRKTGKYEKQIDKLVARVQSCKNTKSLYNLLVDVENVLKIVSKLIVKFKKDMDEVLRKYPATCALDNGSYEVELLDILQIQHEECVEYPYGETCPVSNNRFKKPYFEVAGNRFISTGKAPSFVLKKTEELKEAQTIIQPIKEKLGLILLSHIYKHKRCSSESLQKLVDAEISNVNEEVELRLSMHRPRTDYIKSEIFQPRQLEIEQFQTKLDKYCYGLEKVECKLEVVVDASKQSLTKLREEFEKVIVKLNETMSEVFARYGTLEEIQKLTFERFEEFKEKLSMLLECEHEKINLKEERLNKRYDDLIEHSETKALVVQSKNKLRQEIDQQVFALDNVFIRAHQSVKILGEGAASAMQEVMNRSLNHYKRCSVSIFYQLKKKDLLSSCRLKIKALVCQRNKSLRELSKRTKAIIRMLKQSQSETYVEDVSTELCTLYEELKILINILNYSCTSPNHEEYTNTQEGVKIANQIRYNQIRSCETDYDQTKDFVKDILALTKQSTEITIKKGDQSHDNWIISRHDVYSTCMKGHFLATYGIGVESATAITISRDSTRLSSVVTMNSYWGAANKKTHKPQKLSVEEHDHIVTDVCHRIRLALASKTEPIIIPPMEGEVSPKKGRRTSPSKLSVSPSRLSSSPSSISRPPSSASMRNSPSTVSMKSNRSRPPTAVPKLPNISRSGSAVPKLPTISSNSALPSISSPRPSSAALSEVNSVERDGNISPTTRQQSLKAQNAKMRRGSVNQGDVVRAMNLTETIKIFQKSSRKRTLNPYFQKRIPKVYNFTTTSEEDLFQLIYHPSKFFNLPPRNYDVDTFSESMIVSFPEKVKFSLRHTLEDYIIASEIFYRQKNLVIPHPDKVHSNIDLSVKDFTNTLKSYLVEAFNYTRLSITKVNDVLEGLHVTQKAIPKILFTFINTDCKSDLDQLKQKMAGICGALAKDNSVEKKRLWSQLTTKFYHPNQHDELQALRAKDNERKLLFLKTLRTNHKKSLRALEDIETVVLAKLTFCADKLLEAADITIYPEYIKEIRPKLKVT